MLFPGVIAPNMDEKRRLVYGVSVNSGLSVAEPKCLVFVDERSEIIKADISILSLGLSQRLKTGSGSGCRGSRGSGSSGRRGGIRS